MTARRFDWLGIPLLLAVATVGWWSQLLSSAPLGDEGPYWCAAQAVLEGRELASCHGYLYAEGVARGAAALLSAGGPFALRVVLRGSVWLGAAATLWLSLSLTRWSFAVRAAVGAAAILAWSPVAQCLSLGNLSAATAGLAVASLVLRARHSAWAGILLGLAISLKPLPAAVPVVLLSYSVACYWRARTWPWPELTTGLVAVGVVAALALAGGGFAAAPPFNAVAENPITLVRVVHELGLTASGLACFVVVVVLGAALATLRGVEPPLLDALALATSLLAAPLVWNHSFMLATPGLALALAHALAAYRAAGAERRARQRAILVTLAAVAAGLFITVSDAFGIVAHGSRFGFLLLLFPLFAPSGLVALLWFERSGRSHQA